MGTDPTVSTLATSGFAIKLRQHGEAKVIFADEAPRVLMVTASRVARHLLWRGRAFVF